MRYNLEPIYDIIDLFIDDRDRARSSEDEWPVFFLRRMIRIGSPVWLTIIWADRQDHIYNDAIRISSLVFKDKVH
jgi:hypothetical protein